MDEVTSRRWDKDPNPSKHKPRDAVAKFLEAIDEGRVDPTHVVICYAGNDSDGEDTTSGYFQAGSLDGYFGAIGLLARISQIIGADLYDD